MKLDLVEMCMSAIFTERRKKRSLPQHFKHKLKRTSFIQTFNS